VLGRLVGIAHEPAAPEERDQARPLAGVIDVTRSYDVIGVARFAAEKKMESMNYCTRLLTESGRTDPIAEQRAARCGLVRLRCGS